MGLSYSIGAIKMRINKSVFRYIEHELYNYEQTKKELQLYREQILESSPSPEVSVQSGPGDSTATKAIRLTSSTFVIHAEKVINAIEKSLAMLSEQHRILFKHKYQDCKPWQEIVVEMGISDRQYFKLRREIVIAVGQKLGLLNVE